MVSVKDGGKESVKEGGKESVKVGERQIGGVASTRAKRCWHKKNRLTFCCRRASNFNKGPEMSMCCGKRWKGEADWGATGNVSFVSCWLILCCGGRWIQTWLFSISWGLNCKILFGNKNLPNKQGNKNVGQAKAEIAVFWFGTTTLSINRLTISSSQSLYYGDLRNRKKTFLPFVAFFMCFHVKDTNFVYSWCFW